VGRTIVIRAFVATGLGLLIASCGSHMTRTPAAIDLSSDVRSIDAADARATGMLELVRLPAGAAAISAAPPGLTTSKNIPANGLPAVSQPKYWTVPGLSGDVLDYVRSHPPAGLLPQSDTVPGEVEFASGDKEGCACNILVVRVVPQAGHSALRTDAVVIWRRP
jgi:hypothetical protein